MIGQEFRVLLFDAAAGRGNIVLLGGRNEVAGGSGLAAMLYAKYGHPTLPASDAAQPLIFAIGPLTGYFPLMSKMVCSFKSNYHNEYTESHAGGRAALALRFADLDALVIIGRAKKLSCLCIGANRLEIRDAIFLRGMDA